MKKTLALFLFAVPFSSFANYPFNGTYCGKGTVNIDGKIHSGLKVVEVKTTFDSLRLIRSKVILDSGGYIEGRPEVAQIIEGKILFDGHFVGTISSKEIHTKTNISGYEIEYIIRNIGLDRISYFRTSKNVSNNFYSIYDFGDLSKGSCSSI